MITWGYQWFFTYVKQQNVEQIKAENKVNSRQWCKKGIFIINVYDRNVHALWKKKNIILR